MSFTPFTKDDRPTMEAFNEKFESAIKTALNLILENPKVVYGSYIGDGTFGEDHPNSLSFNSKIMAIIMILDGETFTLNDQNKTRSKLIMVSDELTTDYSPRKGFLNTLHSNYEYDFGKKSNDGKTFYWYSNKRSSNTDSEAVAKDQFNGTGIRYAYIAILE